MSKRMDKKELIESLKGLIVSCQTQPDEPIHTDDMVVKMAEAAQWEELLVSEQTHQNRLQRSKQKLIFQSSDFGKSGMTIRMYLSHQH